MILRYCSSNTFTVLCWETPGRNPYGTPSAAPRPTRPRFPLVPPSLSSFCPVSLAPPLFPLCFPVSPHPPPPVLPRFPRFPPFSPWSMMYREVHRIFSALLLKENAASPLPYQRSGTQRRRKLCGYAPKRDPHKV